LADLVDDLSATIDDGDDVLEVVTQGDIVGAASMKRFEL
jgi:hypothetical protein